MAEYKKPFEDWTLGELKDYCISVVGKIACQKGGCPFKTICDRITDDGRADELVPGDWDLTEKPRFTEQDKSDAKTLLRVFPWASKVVRYGHELQVRAVPEDGRICDIAYEMFPSVLVGNPEFLNTILHEGEVDGGG